MPARTLTSLAIVALLAPFGFAASLSEKVQQAVSRGFVNGQPALSEAPRSALASPISQQEPTKGLSSFKEASDLLARKGVDRTLSVAFCSTVELDCGGKPWPVKAKGAESDTINKVANIGKSGKDETVVLVRQLKDKTRLDLYVCDAAGGFLRAYEKVGAGRATRVPADQAKAGFESEKQWWMDWLPDNTAASADVAGK